MTGKAESGTAPGVGPDTAAKDPPAAPARAMTDDKTAPGIGPVGTLAGPPAGLAPTGEPARPAADDAKTTPLPQQAKPAEPVEQAKTAAPVPPEEAAPATSTSPAPPPSQEAGPVRQTAPTAVDPSGTERGSVATLVDPPGTERGSVATLVDPPGTERGSVATLVDPPGMERGTVTTLVDPPSKERGSVATLVDSSGTERGTVTTLVDPPGTESGSVGKQVDSPGAASGSVATQVDSPGAASGSVGKQVDSPDTASGSVGTLVAPYRERGAVATLDDRSAIDVSVFGRTDVGLVREHNEDNFLIADLTGGNRSLLPEVRSHRVGARGSLFVVCDGMGGAAAGEVASQLAVDTIYERLQGDEAPAAGIEFARRIVEAIEEAGLRIFSSAKLDRSRRGMGTTSTAAGLIDGELFLCQVGDSRAYVVRGDQIELVTRDQSLVNQLIEAGQLTAEEAEAFEHSNIILQALGTAAEVSVDVTHVMLRRGDTLVVCSDGLSGIVPADQIKETVRTNPEPIECCKRLTEMANAGGGHDNITVIVARFEGDGLPPASPEDRLAFARVTLPAAEEPEEPPARSPSIKAPPPPSGEVVEEQPTLGSPPRKGGSSLVLILLVLLAAAGLAYLLLSGSWITGEPTAAPSAPLRAPPPVARPAPAVVRPVAAMPTSFRTRLGRARLLVDGVDRGPFSNGAVKLPLTAGSHDVAVMVDGTAVVSKRVTVLAGVENDFTLDEPGTDPAAEGAPAPLAPVAPVPIGEPTPPSTPETPTVRPPAKVPVVRPPRPPPVETAPDPQPPVIPENPFDGRGARLLRDRSGPAAGEQF